MSIFHFCCDKVAKSVAGAVMRLLFQIYSCNYADIKMTGFSWNLSLTWRWDKETCCISRIPQASRVLRAKGCAAQFGLSFVGLLLTKYKSVYEMEVSIIAQGLRQVELSHKCVGGKHMMNRDQMLICLMNLWTFCKFLNLKYGFLISALLCMKN